MSSPEAWGTSDLFFAYRKRVALTGVSLSAPPGQVTAVAGSDGAGKTTLLRCLTGSLAPGAGTVRRPAKERIGYQPASSGIYPDLTVTENLDFRATGYRMSRQAARERAAGLLDRTGLTGAAGRLAGQLSGGMRQKLAVIAAMLHRPELLVLDEPTTGVDPVSRSDLWWLIASAAAEGSAVVLATSYLYEAERCASVLALDAGTVVAAGIAEEIRRRPARPPAVPLSGAPLAQVAGATKRFGAFTAVADVDLEVRPGEIVGLLGANGAGKTTLIRMLLGLIGPSEGSVALFGQSPSRQTRRRLGYVPQGLGLYDDLTTAENMEFTAACFGRGADKAVLPEEIRPYAGDLIGALPLGVQRRISFAQALSHRPDLLILDEPTSGVDPAGRAGLWDTIGRAARAGAGVLVTTHYMEEAAECGRLVIMADGAVVATGTTADIIGSRQVVLVEAESWAQAFGRLERAGLKVALAGRGLRLPGADPAQVRQALGDLTATVRLVPATLEERFFELAQRQIYAKGARDDRPA
jgi:ABC-2 type transport system ATP-binding protein